MTVLADAPGGAAFIASIADAAKSLALVYAGTSDVPARAHLDGYLSIIEPTLTDAVGARSAAKIIDAMRAAVIGHKHELESRGSSRA